jgi:predicted regulator of Ras-like GTPase activity (Roadblock/LC7/MglB family)
MTEAGDAILAHIKSACAADGILGASLVERDGLHILGHWDRGVNLDTMSAMTAAMVGAAEAALADMGVKDLQAIQVTADAIRLHLLGVDEDHILVVATPVGGKADLERLQNIVKGVQGILQEG